MQHAQPFVGRETERSLLSRALGRALAGAGSVATVTGEPGIGKTRLLEELGSEAQAGGATVVWGHAYEQQGAPPFWPWIELLRAAVRDVEDGLLPGLFAGDRAPALALLPELREGAAGLPEPPPVANADEARWLLFEGVTSLFREAAAGHPLVLLLEDAQWADRASLLLLRHMAQRLAGAPLLLAVTYRDEGAPPTHPLQQALRAISRAEDSARVELGGLNVAEVQSYLDLAGVLHLDADLAEIVAERTAGNPFFLREVTLVLQHATSSGDALTQVPTAVREALARRLLTVTHPTAELLNYAAIVGREVRLAELASIARIPDTTALTAQIEEALARGVLTEPRTGSYRFVHALLRDAVLERLSATRRAQLHGEVGLALAEIADQREVGTGTAEVARHLVEAAQIDDSLGPPALDACLDAARQAHEARAWEAAGDHYDDAVDLLDQGVPGDRAQILLQRGESRQADRRDRDAWRDLLTAADEFARAGDSAGQARAAFGAAGINAPNARKLNVLSAALDANDLDARTRALLLAKRSQLLEADGRADLEEATRLAGAEPPAELQAELFVSSAELLFLEGRFDEAAPLFRSAFELLDRLGRYADAARVLGDEHDCYLIGGEYRRALEAYPDLIGYTRRTRQRLWENIWLGDWAGFALMRGDVSRALEALAEASPNVAWTYYTITVGLAEYTGEAPDAPLVAPIEIAAGVPVLERPVFALRARAALFQGDSTAAEEAVARWSELQVGHTVIGHGGAICDGALQACGTRPMIEAYAGFLARWPTARASVSSSLDRFRGSLALKLGRLNEARGHLESALAWCERSGCFVEAARTRRDLASLLVKEGDVAAARGQLETALGVFAEYGAGGYAAEARDYLESLEAATTNALTDSLSGRELEVLTLVATGRTNRQVGEALAISHFTAANHVKNILAKTGCATRTEAVAYAITQGLIDATGED